jgi:hypothetical protein
MANLPTSTVWTQVVASGDSPVADQWTQRALGTPIDLPDGARLLTLPYAVPPVEQAQVFINDTTAAISAIADRTMEEDATSTFTPSATGTNLVYLISGPSWATINASTGLVTLAPPLGALGAVDVTVTVANSCNSVSDTFTVTVTEESAITLATLPVVPTLRYHAGLSAVTEVSGRATVISDLMGYLPMEEDTGTGPRVMTDDLGRKFWRLDNFRDNDGPLEKVRYMKISTDLAVSHRNCGVIIVGIGKPEFSLGNRTAGTHKSANALMESNVSGLGQRFLTCISNPASADATNGKWCIPGLQMQVFGCLSRTTANGGSIISINRKNAFVAQASTQTGFTGAEFGRDSNAPNERAEMDAYEVIFFNGTMTTENWSACMAAVADHYGIPEVENSFVAEGDSISQDWKESLPETALAWLARPGAGVFPATWRVSNVAVAGSKIVSNLTGRSAAATSWSLYTLPGENVAVVEIGVNDMSPTVPIVTPADIRPSYVSWLNNATNGILQRGWDVRIITNIAVANAGKQAQIVDWRTILNDPALLTDIEANTGQTYEGKVTVLPTHQITVGGVKVFETSADVNTTYYDPDGLHPASDTGARVRLSGGDDPTKGIAYGLT